MLHLPEFGRGSRDKRWIVLLRTYSCADAGADAGAAHTRSHAQANAGAADSRSDTGTYY